MTGRIGVDYAFEVIGNPRTIEQCIKVVRRGGTAVLVGVGGAKERFSVSSLVLPLTGKSVLGCMYGSVNTKVDFPLYLDLYPPGPARPRRDDHPHLRPSTRRRRRSRIWRRG